MQLRGRSYVNGEPICVTVEGERIARVDPATKQVKVWPLPKGSSYANLNTAAFDNKGRIWFTGQSGVYGRLDPASGDMKVWDAPKGRGP